MAETGIPSSFIPHDTGIVSTARKPRGGGGLNDLLLLCVIVLFVASAALGVGVFLYQQFLQTESTSKVSQLERAKAAFEPSLIQQLTRLDDRMHAAGAILGLHIVPTEFFTALEQATLQTISFQTLDLEAPDAQHINIKMAGTAQSVNSIALQADLFSKNGVITGPIFSNIARQNDGVHFDLTAAVNPAAIGYSTLAASVASGGALQSTPAPVNTSPFGGALPSGSGTPPSSTAVPSTSTSSAATP